MDTAAYLKVMNVSYLRFPRLSERLSSRLEENICNILNKDFLFRAYEELL